MLCPNCQGGGRLTRQGTQPDHLFDISQRRKGAEKKIINSLRSIQETFFQGFTRDKHRKTVIPQLDRGIQHWKLDSLKIKTSGLPE
jgi:hypothetical protein